MAVACAVAADGNCCRLLVLAAEALDDDLFFAVRTAVEYRGA